VLSSPNRRSAGWHTVLALAPAFVAAGLAIGCVETAEAEVF